MMLAHVEMEPESSERSNYSVRKLRFDESLFSGEVGGYDHLVIPSGVQGDACAPCLPASAIELRVSRRLGCRRQKLLHHAIDETHKCWLWQIAMLLQRYRAAG